jgi:hypothetical protein
VGNEHSKNKRLEANGDYKEGGTEEGGDGLRTRDDGNDLARTRVDGNPDVIRTLGSSRIVMNIRYTMQAHILLQRVINAVR